MDATWHTTGLGILIGILAAGAMFEGMVIAILLRHQKPEKVAVDVPEVVTAQQIMQPLVKIPDTVEASSDVQSPQVPRVRRIGIAEMRRRKEAESLGPRTHQEQVTQANIRAMEG